MNIVDLLILTSLDQLLYIMKYNLPFYKTSYINQEVNCTESSPSVSVPGSAINRFVFLKLYQEWQTVLAKMSVILPCRSALQICPADLPCNSALRFCPANLPCDSALQFCLAILPCNSALILCPMIQTCNSTLQICPAILPYNSALQFCLAILPCNSALQFCPAILP